MSEDSSYIGQECPTYGRCRLSIRVIRAIRGPNSRQLSVTVLPLCCSLEFQHYICSMARSQKTPRWALFLFVAIGIFLMLVATNVIPSPDEKFHVPRWVVFVCGLIFVAPAAAQLIFRQHPRAARYMIAFMLLCFGLVGGACGLLGDDESISGGLPFVSHETNVLLARCAFTFGGLLCLALSGTCAMGYGTVLGESKLSDDSSGGIHFGDDDA